MTDERCQNCTWTEVTTREMWDPEYIQVNYCVAHLPEWIRLKAEAWAEVEAAEVQS